jgi:serine/threonine protein kinase
MINTRELPLPRPRQLPPAQRGHAWPALGPRIIDFGVARSVNATALTTMNAVAGTSGYVSPEQLGCRELTPRIDVFALGGVLVFAATGHGPFDAPDLPQSSATSSASRLTTGRQQWRQDIQSPAP